jgi:hypothetical protein
MIPGNMKPTNALNDGASLQYQNRLQELYIIVIDNAKEEFMNDLVDNDLLDIYPASFEGYCDLLSDHENNSGVFLEQQDKHLLTRETIHNLPATTFENVRRIEKMDIYYKIALIEGKEHYYNVVAWTLASRKKRFEKTIATMIASFKEN